MAAKSYRIARKHWIAKVGDYVTGLKWTPDGKRLAVATGEGPIIVFDGQNGVERTRFRGHALGTLSISWTSDGKTLASGGQEKFVRLWGQTSDEEVAKIDCGVSTVEHLAWSPFADTLAVAAGKQMRLFDRDGRETLACEKLPNTISDFRWRADGARIAAISFGGVRLYDLMGPAPAKVCTQDASLISMAWSPEDRFLIAGTQEATIIIFDLDGGEPLQAGPYQTKVREIAFDPTGQYLATGGGADISVWTFKNGNMAGTRPVFLEGHREFVTVIAYQPRGPVLASCGKDGQVFFWLPSVSDQPALYGELAAEAVALEWSPDGQFLATASAEGEIVVWRGPELKAR